MPANTPNTVPPTTRAAGQRNPGSVPQKSGKGCFFWGCMTLIVLTIVSVLGIWLILMGVRKQVDSFIADEPVDIQIYQPTGEEVQLAKSKLADLQKAVDEGQATTVSLTADDLNTLVATEKDLQDLKGKLFFKIDEQDLLGAQASIPLSMLAQVPLINLLTDWEGKHLNGDVDLKINTANDQVQVYIQDIQVKGEPLSEDVMREIRNKDLLNELRTQQDPQAQQNLRKFEETVESIDVRDGQLIIRTREKESAPAAEPAPEAPAPAPPAE